MVRVIDNRFARVVAEINNISSGSTVVPTGAVLDFAGSSGGVPSGYLLCDGDIYNILDYPDLGGLLGSTYGGNGTTTFAVPDLRGRIVSGQDNMGGSSADRVTDATADSLGGTLGSEDHTLIEAELPVHAHDQIIVQGGVASEFGPTGNTLTSVAPTGQDTGDVGSGDGHSNLQPTMFMNKMIKT